nr:unnamed protein product [Digitaria exilis]
MAVDLPLYLLLALLLAIPVILFTARRSASRGNGASVRLPPSPWAFPVIGHLHHLAGALPHRALRDLARRHGPLMSLRLGELRAVVATSPAAAREIMKAHDAAFASGPLSPMMELGYHGADGIIFAPYGEGWRQLRKICALELLSARRVHSFRHVRADELRPLLLSVDAAAAVASPAVNLGELVAAYVADATVRAIIGSRFRERDEYLRLLQEGLKIMPGMTLPDLFPSSRLARIKNHGRRMREFIDTIIEEHQQSRISREDGDQEEDLLDVLLRLQKEVGFHGPLRTTQRAAHCGHANERHEGTRAPSTERHDGPLRAIHAASCLSASPSSKIDSHKAHWTMAEVMQNPRVKHKAQDEEDMLANLHYLSLVVKETLRLHPPAPLLLPRKCGSPSCQVLGFDVPEETMVIVNAWAIARDPEHWDDEFWPERFEQGGRDFKGSDFELIPFGAGRRMCPGMAFGLAHIELALAALLFHFDWELPCGMEEEELDMTEAFGVTTQRQADLVLVPIPRVPVPME